MKRGFEWCVVGLLGGSLVAGAAPALPPPILPITPTNPTPPPPALPTPPREDRPVITLDGRQPSASARLQAGQSALLRIEGNPTTGYEWMLATENPAGRIHVQAQEGESDPTPDRVGRPHYVRFILTALHTGTVDLRFVYARRWEKDKPVREINLHVEIQP